MTTVRSADPSPRSSAISKVPEVTVWFWIIKVLCTTVGESVADWINTGLGVGLVTTAVLFTVVLGAVLVWQMRLPRYVPGVYWLTVVVLSVTGTLYTDILTDQFGIPLAVSSAVFAALLAVVFGLWYRRERTLSIHSITSVPREAFYWLAILITFALGTAVGDWTLAITGWGAGVAVLLPATLLVAVAVGWRLGANAVLSFWLAYILTRPLGANLGDWFASPTDRHGLGLGTAVTSIVFLVAILGTVVYLTVTRVDAIDGPGHPTAAPRTGVIRERVMLGYFAGVAAAGAALLVWAGAQPHAAPAVESESGTGTVVALTPAQATADFPPTVIATLRTAAADTLTMVRSGDQRAAAARVRGLEAAWDTAQSDLKPRNETAWTFLDSQIDAVLTAVRSGSPDPTTETTVLTDLLTSLGDSGSATSGAGAHP